jgi:hypothetical protein
MQHPTRLKGTFVPNEDYFFKQHLFHIISNLIFILLYFTWVSSSQDNPTGGSCHGRRVFLVPWWIVKLWFARNTFQVGHVKQCNPNFSDTDIFYLILNFHFLHLWMSTGEDGQPHITKFEFISKFFAYCTQAGHLLHHRSTFFILTKFYLKSIEFSVFSVLEF